MLLVPLSRKPEAKTMAPTVLFSIAPLSMHLHFAILEPPQCERAKSSDGARLEWYRRDRGICWSRHEASAACTQTTARCEGGGQALTLVTVSNKMHADLADSLLQSISLARCEGHLASGLLSCPRIYQRTCLHRLPHCAHLSAIAAGGAQYRPFQTALGCDVLRRWCSVQHVQEHLDYGRNDCAQSVWTRWIPSFARSCTRVSGCAGSLWL